MYKITIIIKIKLVEKAKNEPSGVKLAKTAAGSVAAEGGRIDYKKMSEPWRRKRSLACPGCGWVAMKFRFSQRIYFLDTF